MFNMQQIGINISKMRKTKGITQMEMADKLGISFQAVSNWERGISMPDVSKLGEIATIFNVSIDEILDNKRTSEIAKDLMENRLTPDIQMDEIKELAPILRQEQVDTLLDTIDKSKIDVATIASVAPFLSQKFMDDYATGLLEKDSSFDGIASIAPFLSTSILDKAAMEIVRQSGDLGKLGSIAPFISTDLIDCLADIAY